MTTRRTRAPSEPPARPGLEVSGPFALFRRTLLYGRALGSLLPVLAWTRRFRLEADCELRGRDVTVALASGDPIFPSEETRRFDSQVEERFSRDFGRTGLDPVREPEPIQTGGHLVFPSFAVHPRPEPSGRWLVEIGGFWTAQHRRRSSSAPARRGSRTSSSASTNSGTSDRGTSPLRPGSCATAAPRPFRRAPRHPRGVPPRQHAAWGRPSRLH